ncbi:peptidylprolyl isomerase [Sphingomonas gilva]|uniref:Parvulin-like PPIase n=1 Tax=Sphingomonas gilva TaxID=2305907 RepID=A0A396RK52_9SPHN|nr:peptidylprolyl isomerase [Sphingomonas gilva]
MGRRCICAVEEVALKNIAKSPRARLALGALGLILAGAAVAQTAPAPQDDVPPPTNLNLPENPTIFGKQDPNVRKATAIVNGELITGTDVDHRLALVVAANQGQVPPDELERLRLQVVRNLIDETLQIQEAKANEIEVTQQEIDQGYARVARSFQRTPAQFDEFLRQQNSSPKSLKRQIEGELAWQRLLSRQITPFVNVADEEVQSIIARLNASKGTAEYRLGEIFLSGTPDTMEQTVANAQRIIEQLKNGGSFATYARQFSEASTAAVGGDLGWIRAAQLPEQLASAAQELQVGQVAGPIPLPGGVSILLKVDERQILTADPRDAVLSLRQMSIAFPAGTTEAQATQRASQFASAIQSLQGCGRVDEVAKTLGATVVDNDSVRVRDLPPQLQDIMLGMQIGQATPPFGSPTEGVRTLVLCGRDDAQVASAPSFDQVMGQLEEERTNRRAQRYLRDLRRDAVVDYR